MEQPPNEYSKNYSEDNFWEKLKKFAIVAGKEVIEKALQLYYTLQQKDTPIWAKAVIIGALGYFISPIDAIPDAIPVVGYADDLGVLVAAIATVTTYITPEVKSQAIGKMKVWFGE
jgi:uncharacterized membrane protein YkvA (DUF1232 family)